MYLENMQKSCIKLQQIIYSLVNHASAKNKYFCLDFLIFYDKTFINQVAKNYWIYYGKCSASMENIFLKHKYYLKKGTFSKTIINKLLRLAF